MTPNTQEAEDEMTDETKLIPIRESEVERLREIAALTEGTTAEPDLHALADRFSSGISKWEADELCTDGNDIHDRDWDKGRDDAQDEAYAEAHRKLRAAFSKDNP